MVFLEKAVLKCAMTHVQDVTTSTVHAILDVFKDGRGNSVIWVEYNNLMSYMNICIRFIFIYIISLQLNFCHVGRMYINNCIRCVAI